MISNEIDGANALNANQYEMIEQDEEYKQSLEDEGHTVGKNYMSNQEEEDIYNSTIPN
jgi:hypothetical protein